MHSGTAAHKCYIHGQHNSSVRAEAQYVLAGKLQLELTDKLGWRISWILQLTDFASSARVVTIAVNDESEATVEPSPAELAELDEAIVEADRPESVSSAVVLAELGPIPRLARR